MKKIQLLASLLLGILCSAQAQSPDKAYFQQRVDYTIAVRLDDKKHQLEGTINIRYENQSPDTLTFIYMHLWPNAYKNPRTAFSKQFTENGDRGFYFSKKEERGFIDRMAWTSEGKKLEWRDYGGQPDIIRIDLATPLLPNASTELSSPFRVQIPESVSRLGHVEESYQVTQWYPKPAVYDKDGWHPMPYLDQGEFYSEFGSFDVKITLPKNYVVGATGVLQNEEEWDFLNKKIEESKKLNFDALSLKTHDFPVSDSLTKTLHYKADSIHDFAWFADKRFYVLKDQATLPSGRKVDTYAFFTNEEAHLWRRGAEYTRRAVEYYSKVVGEYPYPHATAVQSALGAGGGMEYPMITVIGLSYTFLSLDNVITHEVGHNWFYGILASNERSHAWMDEGWNSYVESRYMKDFYNHLDRTNYLAYLLQARQRIDQASATPSHKLTNINYFMGSYSKPTLVFRYLEEYLGTAEMDRILHVYFEEWKFKHPSPTDLQHIFERESGKDLSWVFQDLMGSSKQLNYGISSASAKGKEAKITIKNKGEIAAPFSISAVTKSDSILAIYWFEGIAGGKDTLITLPFDNTYAYRLDASREMPDIRRNDNLYRTKSLVKIGIGPSPRFLISTRFPEYPFINFAPALGFNVRDGFMLGLAMYNSPIPARDWEYAIAPMFGMKSLTAVGVGELRRNFFPKTGSIQHWSMGLGVKSFNNFDNKNFDYHLRYTRINPNLEFDFRKKEARDYQAHKLRLDNLFMLEEDEIFERPDTVVIFAGKTNQLRSTHRITHTYSNKQPIAPYSITSMAEYANYYDTGRDTSYHYLKLTLEGKFKFYYGKNWAADLRIFMGGFPVHTDRDFGDFPLHLVSRNSNDYHYDEYVLGRRSANSLWENQVNLREGGFKTPIAIAQALADGRSNTFIFSVNFKADVPIKLPIGISWLKLKPYLDLGYYKNSAPSVQIASISQEIFFNGGLMIDVWDGAAGLYLPFFSSSNLNTLLQQRGNFFRQISFSFNLHRLHPKAVADAVISSY